MNRLQSELQRLYLPRPHADAHTDAQSTALIDPAGKVRALVMELTRPPSWEVLAKVWHGVQTELGLPAPAIAVSGIDAVQLWFSLAEPIAVAPAHAFLACLRSRFMPDIEPARLRLLPAPDATALHQRGHARLVPACQPQTGNWSAFVAPDLARVFADTPWLDVAPNEEGQAALLRGLDVTKRTVFEAALEQLGPSARPAHPTHPMHPTTAATATTAAAGEDPQRFLLRVMNDDTVALALRIEAAKALLQHSVDHRPQPGD